MNAAILKQLGWVEVTPGNWMKSSGPKEYNEVLSVPKEAGLIRQRQGRPLLNKLELEAYQWLATTGQTLYQQTPTFRLGNGVRYTPDFFCFDWKWPGEHGVAMPTAFEVKGPWVTDDGVVKVKVFASIYQKARIIMLWKHNGQWKTQTVLP